MGWGLTSTLFVAVVAIVRPCLVTTMRSVTWVGRCGVSHVSVNMPGELIRELPTLAQPREVCCWSSARAARLTGESRPAMWMWELMKTDAGNGAETRGACEPADAQLGAAHASSSMQPHAMPIKTRPRIKRSTRPRPAYAQMHADPPIMRFSHQRTYPSSPS